MGLKYSLVQIGSSTLFGAGGVKEADEAWMPKHVPHDWSYTWPSLVLDVANSETPAQLRSSIQFWHQEFQVDVKVILTVHVYVDGHYAFIECDDVLIVLQY